MSSTSYIQIPILFKGNSTSVTGTITETTLASVNIKGGTIGMNDTLEVFCIWTITSSVSSKTLRVKIGTSEYVASAITTFASDIRRVAIQARNSTSSQVCYPSSSSTDHGSSGSAASTFTEDLSVDKTLAITGQLVSIVDTITLEGCFALLWKEQTR